MLIRTTIFTLSLFLILLNLSSCSSNKNIKSYSGLYKVTSTKCKIRNNFKHFCNSTQFIEIINPKNKFAINTPYAVITWKNDGTYRANSLKMKNVLIRNNVLTYYDKSQHGFTKLTLNKNGHSTYHSSYKSPHQGLTDFYHTLEKQVYSKTWHNKHIYPKL